MTSLVSLLGLGFALGVRHATDPDHVVAVTTIVARERRVLPSSIVGAVWGAGHTATLLVVGGAIVAFRLVVPPGLAQGAELAAAVMLVALGVTSLVRGGRRRSTDAHDVHVGESRSRWLRPLLVGVVHGLAGSAAIALLVLASLEDVRWGAVHEGRFLWVLLNSGSCGAYAFNHDPDTLRGVHSWRQPALYFPTPGGTFAGESLPGRVTWARAYIRDGVLWMDVGRGEVVKLPRDVRDSWWEGTTREWPLMVADLRFSRDALMAHYLSTHAAVYNVFNVQRHLSSRPTHRVLRSEATRTWREAATAT